MDDGPAESQKGSAGAGLDEEPTRDGWFWVSPNGQVKVAVHRDPPESSLKHAVKLMKSHGFVWPSPPKKTVKTTTEKMRNEESEDRG